MHMNDKMKQFLPSVDLEKMKAILDIEERFVTGKINLEQGREEVARRVGSLRPYHLAFIEQTMTEHTDDECIRENMAQKIKLFEGFMDYSRPQLPADHPITHYYEENDELKRLLLQVEDLVQYPVIKNQWIDLIERINEYPVHYKRKQNQLYPVLEQKGFDRPTTTMWTFDDMVRDMMRETRRLLDAGDDDAFVAECQKLVYYGRDLMDKEETILYPTSCAMISEDEFAQMKAGDHEIGYAYLNIEVDHRKAAAEAAAPAAPAEGFAADLAQLLSKYGYSTGTNELLDVTTGKLTLEQINLIYRHMPVDLSFVDENELVCFYTDTDHRVFPRSRNVIGREVMNCHPRKSAHVVKEVIDKLRSGEQDKAEFWIEKPDLFIYILYVAVRDENGRFRGVLEMMQDCTHIRSLKGSRTLLKWADEAGVPAESPSAPAAAPAAPVSTAAPSGVQPLAPPVGETPAAAATSSAHITPDAIGPTTRLAELLQQYPDLKQRLTEISPLFAMLRTPFGKIMAAKADVQKMSDRSGVKLERLVSELKRIVGELAAKA